MMSDETKMTLVTEEADPRQVAEEMAISIRKMYEDRDKKAIAAKEHLVSQLEVTVEKYRTANGVMSALQCVRDVLGESANASDYIEMAKTVATGMANVTEVMAANARDLAPDELGDLCDGFYDAKFSEHESSPLEMVNELMILQLCQNVGPNADDIVDFINHADEEIDKAKLDLMSYCAEHDIDFNELCGPHDNCPCCLCCDCANDCKENRQIKDGQSAYDVCEKFVADETLE